MMKIEKNMKVIILAGGLAQDYQITKTIPKPMVKIGKYPIIIHIMRHYLSYGLSNFIIAVGYKGHIFKIF